MRQNNCSVVTNWVCPGLCQSDTGSRVPLVDARCAQFQQYCYYRLIDQLTCRYSQPLPQRVIYESTPGLVMMFLGVEGFTELPVKPMRRFELVVAMIEMPVYPDAWHGSMYDAT